VFPTAWNNIHVFPSNRKSQFLLISLVILAGMYNS